MEDLSVEELTSNLSTYKEQLREHGGSGHGAKADRSSKTNKQVEHLLETLKKEGLEIDGKITSIVDAEIAKIIAEASRESESSNESKRGGMTMCSAVVTCFGLTLLTVVSVSAGFNMGAKWFENAFREEFARRTKRVRK